MIHPAIKSSGVGHVMRIVVNKRSTASHARMATDYLFTTGQCMEFYYMLEGVSSVQVNGRGEDLIERKLAASNIEVITLQLMFY